MQKVNYKFEKILGYDGWEISTIKQSLKEKEYIRKDKPSESELKTTCKMFNDFGIRNIKIPEFNTLTELLSWRKGIIKKHLARYC